MALGASELPALFNLRETPDFPGRMLKSTIVARVDEIASVASLLMGQADEGRPIVLVSGMQIVDLGAQPHGRALDLVPPAEEDLFR